MATTNECNCNCNTGATDATVRRVYYKDDLDFYMTLIDCDDENIGVPDFDWRARLWTSSKMNYVTVSSVGGVKTNCRIDDGRIHVIVDSHHLMPGKLHIDFEALIPNELYPDGTRRTVVPGIVPIELTADKAPCPSAMEIELMLPYVRGKALTFDDLTDAEKDAFAQQAADLVTIEDLGVASDEEVDEAMGELLDTPPATMKEKTFHLDRRIRRGIMPAKARPGIVYYDYGYIKISPFGRGKNNRGHEFQREIDLSAYKRYIDENPVMFEYGFGNILAQGPLAGQVVNDNNSVYEYDPETAVLRFNTDELPNVLLLKLNYTPKDYNYEVIFDPITGSTCYEILAQKEKKAGVSYLVRFIDKDGEMKRCCAPLIGASEYRLPPLTDEDIREIIRIIGEGDFTNGDTTPLKFKVWAKKKTKLKYDENGNISWQSACRKWAKLIRFSYHTSRDLGGGVRTCRKRMGLAKAVRVSGNRYKSEARVFLFCNEGPLRVQIYN